jgi:hypothetical protein
MMMEARRRLAEDMSAASTERAEQLARDPKPTARPRRDEPGDLAWRAVDLDDALWIVDVMFAKGPKGILSLNGEEVTEANAKKVQSRLRRQRRQITGEIEAVGFGDVHGDYALRLPSEDKCGIAKGPKERLSRLQQPVAIVQKKNSVNLQGKGLKGCGVVSVRKDAVRSDGRSPDPPQACLTSMYLRRRVRCGWNGCGSAGSGRSSTSSSAGTV